MNLDDELNWKEWTMPKTEWNRKANISDGETPAFPVGMAAWEEVNALVSLHCA